MGIIINGKNYGNVAGGNVSISNGNVFIDGKKIKGEYTEDKHIHISIDGYIRVLQVECCEKIIVNGNVFEIESTNGAIECKDVSGDIKNVNCDITANNVKGSCRTVNGDIKKR
ncbi:hypothetical protein IX329_000724 [Fusobacterium necrophorum]|nr:hypothetical protein [Fusobacterium necrophorum]MBR8733151.1 hypothetical protein [Fusobacterium necrophorum]MBR8789305.1 hypothetical protein [Fusobacterium necrophorum]